MAIVSVEIYKIWESGRIFQGENLRYWIAEADSKELVLRKFKYRGATHARLRFGELNYDGVSRSAQILKFTGTIQEYSGDGLSEIETDFEGHKRYRILLNFDIPYDIRHVRNPE